MQHNTLSFISKGQVILSPYCVFHPQTPFSQKSKIPVGRLAQKPNMAYRGLLLLLLLPTMMGSSSPDQVGGGTLRRVPLQRVKA